VTIIGHDLAMDKDKRKTNGASSAHTGCRTQAASSRSPCGSLRLSQDLAVDVVPECRYSFMT